MTQDETHIDSPTRADSQDRRRSERKRRANLLAAKVAKHPLGKSQPAELPAAETETETAAATKTSTRRGPPPSASLPPASLKNKKERAS